MFKKLNNKIRITLFIYICIFATVTTRVIYTTIRDNLIDNYKQLSSQHIIQQTQNVTSYMSLVEETSKLITENNTVISALDSTKFNHKIVTMLDGVKASSLNILSITLYGQNNIVYPSSNTHQIPPYEPISNLIDKTFKGRAFWIVRTEHIAKTNYNMKDLPNFGVLSYISPIINFNGAIQGYLLIDTDLQTLYDFFKPGNNLLFSGLNTYVLTESGHVLHSSYNKPYLSLTPDKKKKLFDGFDFINQPKLFHLELLTPKELAIYFPIPNSDNWLILNQPINIAPHLKKLIFWLLFVDIMLLMLSLFLINLLSESIRSPLSNLYNKMHSISPDQSFIPK